MWTFLEWIYLFFSLLQFLPLQMSSWMTVSLIFLLWYLFSYFLFFQLAIMYMIFLPGDEVLWSSFYVHTFKSVSSYVIHIRLKSFFFFFSLSCICKLTELNFTWLLQLILLMKAALPVIYVCFVSSRGQSEKWISSERLHGQCMWRFASSCWICGERPHLWPSRD